MTEPHSRSEAWQRVVDEYRPAMNHFACQLLHRHGRDVVDPDESADVVTLFLADCTKNSWLERVDPNERPRLLLRMLLRRYTLDYVDACRRRPYGGSAEGHGN